MKCYNCNATEATPLLMCPAPNQCGIPFKAQNLKWKKAEPSAIYADKIFSAHRAQGSSIFYQLNTAEDSDNYTVLYELTPCSCGCGCGCGCSTLSPDAVFEIQKSYVQLDCFSVNETAEPGAASGVITPEMVTVNGLQVAGITASNGLYTANIANIITQLTNPACMAQDLPSKAFLLLQDIPDLEIRVRFGFEGVVRSNGCIYRFKLYLANNETIPLLDTLTTSFAIAEVNIPCIENGMVPRINFRFSGKADLINPVLSVAASEEDPDEIVVNLTGTLGIIPEVCVEVVRNTLMLVNGAELCDTDKCGLDGFNLYAGSNCCNANANAAAASNASGMTRGGCGCGCGCGCAGRQNN